MRYALVSLLLLAVCTLFIQLHAGNTSNFYRPAAEDPESTTAEARSAGEKQLGSVSCEEAHALIRAKKNDQSLREGLWQLNNQDECPVLSPEAYAALSQ